MNRTIDRTQKTHNLEEFEVSYSNLTKNYDELLTKLTRGIGFSSTNLAQAKDTLSNYVIDYNKIRDEKTIKERICSSVSMIPFVGKHATQVVDNIRKERLNALSVSDVVTDLYDGLSNKAKELEKTIKTLSTISSEAQTMLTLLITVDSDLDDYMLTLSNTEYEYISAVRLSSQVKLLRQNTTGKIESTVMIIQVGTGLLTKMVKVLPVNKTELLSNMAMDSGVSQINSISRDVLEITKLTQDVSDTIFDKTNQAVMELLQFSTVTESEVNQLKINSAKRMKLTQEVNNACVEMNESLVRNHAEIVKHTQNFNNHVTFCDVDMRLQHAEK